MTSFFAIRSLASTLLIFGLVTGQAGASEQAADLALASATDHGLPSPDLSAVTPDAALIAYASAQHGGRIDPSKFDRDWALHPEPYDAAASYRQALASGRLEAWIAALPPTNDGYRGLVDARRRYSAVGETGGWGTSPPVGLKRGSIGVGVTLLRKRLDAEGYVSAPGRAPSIFDARLEQALRLFELRRGLPADGVVTSRVQAAMAVPPEAILASIDANLERWRWLPRRMPPDRIEVNIAAAELTLFQADQLVMIMRTVVGDPKHRTPIFVARAVGVVLNPPWNVPTSIAARELYPKEARQPGYLASHGFTAVNGQLRQSPGARNSLGRLKIDLDDPYAIYLHDTPQRSLFSLDGRALSHGCIRLERPLDLAEALVAPQGLSADDLGAILATAKTRRLTLAKATPVYLTYQTVVANPDGTVSFHPDVYDWDDELNAALSSPDAIPVLPRGGESARGP